MSRVALFVLAVAVSACSLSIDLGDSTPAEEYDSSVELSPGLEQVDATIWMGEGRLVVSGRTAELLSGEFLFDEPDLRPTIVFEGEGETGRLRVEQPDGDLDDDEYTLLLSDQVRFDVSVEMGAGASTLDLAELQVGVLDASLGAGDSQVVLPEGVESADLQLGAGDVTVDASALAADATITVERGAGGTEVIVPAGVTVEVDAEQGLGDIDAEGFTNSGGRLVREGDTDPDEVLTVVLRGGVGDLVLTVAGA